MKTLFLGDTHGKSFWKLITQLENPDRVVFIGDYFDSYNNFSTVEEVHNFKEIMEYKKNSGKDVICLIGNHDFGYFNGIDGTRTSGYQHKTAVHINQILEENKHHLQMAYQMGDIVCTHAGISSEWCDDNLEDWNVENLVEKINELWEYKPLRFEFNGRGFNSSGDDTYQTPIWIRPYSLMKVNRCSLKEQIIQIVGHTKMNRLDTSGKATDGRYYFIDVFDTSHEYLIYENEQFKIGKF